MPYTPKAHRFFEAVAHGMKPKNGSKLSQGKAKELAAEGVKIDNKDKSNRKKLYGKDS